MPWALVPQTTALVPAVAVWVKLPPYWAQMNWAEAWVAERPRNWATALRLVVSLRPEVWPGPGAGPGDGLKGVTVILKAGLRRKSGYESPFLDAPVAREGCGRMN